MRIFSLYLLALLLPIGSWAQTTYWTPRALDDEAFDGRYIIPSRALGLEVDTADLRSILATAPGGTLMDLAGSPALLELPLPDGRSMRFRFLETPLMHPELAARYPFVRTYSGVAADNAAVRLKFDLTPAGFHAMITGLPEGDAFIDPVYQGNATFVQAYWKRDLARRAEYTPHPCSYDEVNDLEQAAELSAQWIEQSAGQRAGDCQFRTYRLALACTGEYANFHGATGGNKAPAIAAMATTLNRVNGIYECDAALTMVLVANNDQLVFTDPATDGYTNQDGGAMLDENMSKCNAVIGSANYDIGHVFSTGGGGVAYLNSPCTSYKAGGVTGLPAPVGDPFDIDYVCHEMGHQYGGNHSQNNNCQRASQASVEVGSGITIMGYAGVCSPNVEPHSIAMLGGYSLQEIHANITTGYSSGCPTTVPLINQPPTVSGGGNHTIPYSTPFVLTAVATDPDPGDGLTYSWEQMDPQSSTQPPLATSTKGPNFRPWLPTTEPRRWFPRLDVVASGSNPSPNWEVLASVGRTYKFRITVRDNAIGGGCNAQDNVTITVSGSAGPFVVTQPNTALTWTSGSARTVTWNVAGTASSPVGCTAVDILLSVDGGLNWPYTLATAVANNGTAQVTLPMVASTSARIMVRANGNVFYDMSDQNFTMEAPAAVSAKAFLEGPYDVDDGLMGDDLRAAGLLPSTEPYTALGFAQAGDGGGEICLPAVFAVTGPNAIVDWVRLELRSATNPATIVGTRQALLQRDGDIVETDGLTPVVFNVTPGNYYVAVRHRNHLGCMTASAISVGPLAPVVNFTLPATAVYGSEARKAMGGARLLWMGNASPDDRLSYTGSNNDRDAVLAPMGGLPTAIIPGYLQADCNLDGTVRYTGARNDRDPILLNTDGTVPTAIRLEQLP